MPLEYLLNTNEYNKPQVLSGKDAIAAKLLILLNMEPGTNVLHPEMGIGMKKRYRYCTEDDIGTLQEDIDLQINVYFPKDISSQCKVTANYDTRTNEIHIYITVDETLYSFNAGDNGAIFALNDDNENDPYDRDYEPEDEEDIDDSDTDGIENFLPTYPGDAGAI